MGKSGICKLSTLAILSGDVSNTSLSNCGNMRPHVTANPSSNSSNIKSFFRERPESAMGGGGGVIIKQHILERGRAKLETNYQYTEGCNQ